MDKYDEILADINIPISEIKIQTVQDVLKLSKENKNTGKEFWNQVSEVLWNHLLTGFKTFDDQLLSATCFYTVLPLTDKQNVFLMEMLKLFDEELFIKKNKEGKFNKTYNVVSLMYGMFQSTFLLQNTNDDVTLIKSVLKSVFDLLILMGYEYSKYTFIIFKTMKLFKKLYGTVLQECIFNKENQIKLLNFINHNWENPVNGIRDLNRSIFQTLISTLDNETYDTMLREINRFYWNKAKYLMLSEIIEHHTGNIISLVQDHRWVEGLIYSLHKPGLVSAGADMYYALLKQINFENDWCQIFLNHIIKILNGPNSKAIENFNNFWCLITINKFPIHLVLLDTLKDQPQSEQNLCSQLCLIKQANKLGFIKKDWSSRNNFSHIENIVSKGLDNCNYFIRMLSFDIVCVTQTKLGPSQLEYDFILNFLKNNVNSDCTVLRLSMINSFNIFLTQLHSVFLNVMIKNVTTKDLEHLLQFCERLQKFVYNSINLNGNYQRKITSVKLCNVIISCFSEIPNKKRGQIRHTNITLIKYVKDNGCWLLSTEAFVLKLVNLLKDPADDVRENVVKLLLNHYFEELKEPLIMQHLVDGALKSTKSKFFYEISCGRGMFKLLTNLVMKDKHSVAEYQTVEDIFNFAYTELISEHIAKTNIMASIEAGKQLHSYMNILIVVLETSISFSYKIDIKKITPEFVSVLESISNQFSWEEESSTSSDFSKMNDMVEHIIDNSGVSIGDESDQTKISSLHQIVLNSLWLNVKAACDLASILIQFNDNDGIVCEQLLNIITHVLETSRHKGAIEAAGAALGKGIQHLTLLPEENKVSEVPYTLLKCKLNDLISETNKMASITRRGAGLSIMVHRIVSSDMKKGKPLFHYFINTLLEICNTIQVSSDNHEHIENQVDLPKAIYIHFMTRIVTDSSLASEMMFYFAKLAELAFGNLTSPHWQIRNAALQLYGALIPKQIGEKKASGSDEVTTATVACDELRTHSPSLWNYIMQQLKLDNNNDILQSHSNLVPILNLLANSAKRYNFSYDLAEQKTRDEELLNCLVLLLGSPIQTVRRLTAKCIFNIYDLEIIYDVLLNRACVSENYLHGSLILLSLCCKSYLLNLEYDSYFEKLRDKFITIFNNSRHSYLCKRMYEDIFVDNYSLKDIEESILEMKNNGCFPGVDQWAETRLQKYINTCLWADIPVLLNILIQQSNFERYCELIFIKIEKDEHVSEDILLEVVKILLSFERKYNSGIIWKVLYEISLRINISNHLDIPDLLKTVQGMESVYKLRYIMPLVARNIVSTPNDYKLILMKIIIKLSDFEISDVDMRYITAIANNEIANNFDNLQDPMKVSSIKCAIMLLQDEDEDVRNLSVHYYQRLSKLESVVQPYICFNNILSKQFLCTIFGGSQSLIKELVEELTKILQSSHSVDEYNPFANDSKNIYFEPNTLQQLIGYLNK